MSRFGIVQNIVQAFDRTEFPSGITIDVDIVDHSNHLDVRMLDENVETFTGYPAQDESRTHTVSLQVKCSPYEHSSMFWFTPRGSNPDSRIQSPLSYH